MSSVVKPISNWKPLYNKEVAWGYVWVEKKIVTWVAQEQANNILVYVYKDVLDYVASQKVSKWDDVPGAIRDLCVVLTPNL